MLTEAQQRYREYLKSPHWRQIRARILLRAEEHCEWCGRFCGPNPHQDEDYPPCQDDNCWYCRNYSDDAGWLPQGAPERQFLEIHHLTYARIGHEDEADLVALCWGCHESTWKHRDESREAWQRRQREIAARWDARHRAWKEATDAQLIEEFWWRALRGETDETEL